MKPISTRKRKKKILLFEKFSAKVAKMVGAPIAFTLAFQFVVLWLITGPIFQYSDTWLLIINTVTGIVTFLMVFIIQQAQNKDTLAIQLKLNELIAASKGASNRVINVEDLTDKELRMLKDFMVG